MLLSFKGIQIPLCWLGAVSGSELIVFISLSFFLFLYFSLYFSLYGTRSYTVVSFVFDCIPLYTVVSFVSQRLEIFLRFFSHRSAYFSFPRSIAILRISKAIAKAGLSSKFGFILSLPYGNRDLKSCPASSSGNRHTITSLS